MFAIKTEVCDPGAEAFVFSEQKTMYGGKYVARGDMIFVFASENEGGPGLIARGIVTSVGPTPKKLGLARQTARVSITIRRTAIAKRRLGRSELRLFSDWNDGRPDDFGRRHLQRPRPGERQALTVGRPVAERSE